MEVLFCSILSAVIILLVYWIIRSFHRQTQQQIGAIVEKLPHPSEKPATTASANLSAYQLQAYERMTLFIERIRPANLLPRIMQAGQNVQQLQTALLQTIREEYEHNLTQQLYISDLAWESCKATKENITRGIIRTASELKADDPATQLAQQLLTTGFNNGNDPIGQTLKLLKQELQKI